MSTRDLVRSFMAAAALLALPGALLAQDVSRADLEAEAGVALPVGDLGKFADPGLGVGVGGAFWVHDNVALRADADFAGLSGEAADEGLADEGATPGMNLLHYGVGVEFDIPGRGSPSLWEFQLNVGVGGTTLDTDDFLDTVAADEEQDITRTYPNVNGGILLGRRVAENLSINLRGQVFWTFSDDVDLAPLSDLRVRDDLERVASAPVTLSIRWDLPG